MLFYDEHDLNSDPFQFNNSTTFTVIHDRSENEHSSKHVDAILNGVRHKYLTVDLGDGNAGYGANLVLSMGRKKFIGKRVVFREKKRKKERQI